MDDSIDLYGPGGGLLDMDLDRLVEKAGGRFRLASLIQRRMRDLQRGAPVLVERPAATLIQTAVEEYYLSKIWAVQGEEAEKLRKERSVQASPRSPRAKGGAGAADTGSSGTGASK